MKADRSSALPIIVVTGLTAEARIARGAETEPLAGGGDAGRLSEKLGARLAQGARAVISFGIAGGLAPGLSSGTVLVAGAVHASGQRWEADDRWRRALLAALPDARSADLAGVDGPVASALAKAELHRTTGAAAVDMESHVAARLAARHGVPFAALRVIADPAERGLPRAALVGMRSDGSADVPAVLRALLRRPADLTGLLRTAVDASAAFRALRRSRSGLADLFDRPGSGRENERAFPAGARDPA